VTFELVVTHGVKCTLVEPRPFKLDRMQHRVLRERGLAAEIVTLVPPPVGGYQGEQRRQQQLNGQLREVEKPSGREQAVDGPMQGDGGLVAAAAAAVGGCGRGGGFDSTQQQQQQQQQQEEDDEEEQWWRHEDEEEEEGEEGEGGDGTAQEQFEWLAAMQAHSAGTTKPQQQRADGNGSAKPPPTPTPSTTTGTVTFNQVRGFFGPELWRSTWWAAQNLENCTCIIGQHPDEATELIVDYALASDRPFAVMPCCVFPRRFPWRRRRLPDGSEAAVVVYAELVDYLLQKAGARGAGEVTLAFDGCNRVVWAPGGGGGEVGGEGSGAAGAGDIE